jgi:hypothetical protein
MTPDTGEFLPRGPTCSNVDPDLSSQYELAYEEGKRALDAQEKLITELRSRAGVLIAAAAVTTSLFGGRAVEDGAVGLARWVAIACFVLVGLTVLAVLWPRDNWILTVDAGHFVATYIERETGPREVPQIHRDLALHMSASYAWNGAQFRRLSIVFRIGAVLLVGEVVAWVIGLLEGP